MADSPFQDLNPSQDTSIVKPNSSGELNPANCDNTVSVNQQFFGCDSNATKEFLDGLADSASNIFGVQINYWRSNFDITKAHPLWGTQCDEKFIGPYCINAYVNIEGDSSLNTLFGMQSQVEGLSLEISYNEWAKISPTASPLADDRFEIKNQLCNRPSGFNRIIYKVTSQGDGDLFTASPRWMLRGVRDTFTWLDGQPQENNDNQPFGGSFIGPTDEFGDPLSSAEENELGYDIDDLAREDYDNSVGDKDEAFGGYYDR